MQDPLQEDRNNNVIIDHVFDLRTIEHIIKQAGSPSLKKEAAYLRTAKFFGKGKFKCGIISGGAGFYAGTLNKEHFRLVSIAVVEKEHGKGYGTAMMLEIIKQCRRRKIKKITLRTNRQEQAVNFYKKFGGKIVGINGEDYEMEIPICFT